MIFLYIKTHNKTGLKYFGRTTQKDVHKYKGSGLFWTRHCKKYGYDYSTEIIASFNNKEEAEIFSIEFSRKNNIVNSIEWANLKEETIDGGFDHINKNKEYYNEKRKLWYNSLSEIKRNEINHKKKNFGIKNGMFGSSRINNKNPMYGKTHTEETKEKMRKKKLNTVVVKDANNIYYQVDINDIRYKSGDLIHLSKGRNQTTEEKKKRSEINKKLNIKPPSPKGKFHWTNGAINIRSIECPGEDFVRGRTMKKKI